MVSGIPLGEIYDDRLKSRPVDGCARVGRGDNAGFLAAVALDVAPAERSNQ
jgi:hypothetical protein